ncbi:MAG: hypothetical protein KC422_15500 [Trueperaceae bacterium]|nr:hypothetical protein [Trueperaceae bacterium]
MLEGAGFNWLLVGEWLIAFGILAVAIGILWSVIQNRRLMHAENKPNLIIADVKLSKQTKMRYAVQAEAANLGRYPVFLREIKLSTDLMSQAETYSLSELIAAGDSKIIQHDFPHLSVGEQGKLSFYFQYGATGTNIHCVTIPLTIDLKEEPIAEAHLQISQNSVKQAPLSQ